LLYTPTRVESRSARLLVEDVCTSSVFKNPSLLVQKAASRCRLRERFRIFAGNDAPHIPGREPLRSLYPSCNASSIRDVRRVPFRRNAAHHNQSRVTFQTNKLARLLPARAAPETLQRRHQEIKYFLSARAKKISRRSDFSDGRIP
jgi:hypothetical protein